MESIIVFYPEHRLIMPAFLSFPFFSYEIMSRTPGPFKRAGSRESMFLIPALPLLSVTVWTRWVVCVGFSFIRRGGKDCLC